MKKAVTIALAWAMPVLAFAQVRNIYDASAQITGIINNILVPLVFALAFLMFIWGIFQYFIAGGHDEEQRKKGQQLIIFGLIGFAVMAAVWGLVGVLLGTFNLNSAPPQLPVAPGIR